jgi:molybdopterin molybdotransferase
MVTPAEAEKIILDHIVPFHREDCPLAHAHGRVLRVDLVADRDLPPYDRVTLDGFALRSSVLAAGTRQFRIEAVQAAGMRSFKLGPEPEACIEVMTGAVLPEGADCVVPYEEAERAGGTMTVSAAGSRLTSGNAVHRRGDDHRANTVIVRAGTRLSGREIAVAAACGHGVLTVTQQPKIAVVSTGDELVEIDMPVAAHQIRRSNDYALRAALMSAGYPTVARFHLRDVPHEIEHLLWHIIAEYDAVIIVGGVSKGKFDFVPPQLERQGVTKGFHGVAQRPGKPMWFGVSARHTLVFALPGNPVSCYTCLHRYVLPALARASGATDGRRLQAALAEPVRFKPKLTYMVPVKTMSGPAGELLAMPVSTNTSGDFAGLLGTDGFVELPEEPSEFPAGAVAPYWPWA